jgi:hypothetical protein
MRMSKKNSSPLYMTEANKIDLDFDFEKLLGFHGMGLGLSAQRGTLAL